MDPIIILITCALIAWLCASAAWVKWQSPLHMMGIIDNYHLLPFKTSKYVVMTLALAEAVIALAILLPLSRQWGALAAAVLLSGYGIAIGINLVRGRTDFDCGCFGPAGRKASLGRNITGTQLLWRNAVLVGFALLAAAPVSARPLQWLDYALVMLAATFLILMYQIIENLLANHQQLAKL